MLLLSQEGALRMMSVPRLLHHLVQSVCTRLALPGDTTRFLRLCLRPPAALAAENLLLRKQLALYQERHITPQRATGTTRLSWTAHPTAAWTMQQLREAIPADHTYRFLIHDRDTIFS